MVFYRTVGSCESQYEVCTSLKIFFTWIDFLPPIDVKVKQLALDVVRTTSMWLLWSFQNVIVFSSNNYRKDCFCILLLSKLIEITNIKTSRLDIYETHNHVTFYNLFIAFSNWLLVYEIQTVNKTKIYLNIVKTSQNPKLHIVKIDISRLHKTLLLP